jgi:hypothetical protein
MNNKICLILKGVDLKDGQTISTVEGKKNCKWEGGSNKKRVEINAKCY